MHGEAVAIGMVCAARLANLLGLFSSAEEKRQLKVIRQLRLPVSLSGLHLKTETILSAMMRDKKRKTGKLRFVLPTRIGRVVIKEDVWFILIRKVILERGGKP